jgi:hypothetical protein
LDVFDLRDRLIRDYAAYIESFVQIREPRVKEHVRAALEQGVLWPEPLIQLNPTFEPGDWVDDLIRQGVLHEECGNVFRIKPEREGAGKRLRLHKH